MRTIQMTLDDVLVKDVDKIAEQLHTSRSAFTRNALRDAVERFKIRQLEDKHREGYEKHPAQQAEFAIWEDEQEWGDS